MNAMRSERRGYRMMSRFWQVTTALVGMALMLGLFLNPAPASAQQQPQVAVFEIAYINPQDQTVFDRDCWRFSLTDGLFRSDLFFGLGVPDGLWSAVGVAEGFVFSAFMHTLITSETTGQPAPFTIALGGLLAPDLSTLEATTTLSSGVGFPVLGVLNSQCVLQSSTTGAPRSLQEFGS